MTADQPPAIIHHLAPQSWRRFRVKQYDYLLPREWCVECETFDSNEPTVILQGVK